MKRILLVFAVITMAAGGVFAQSHLVTLSVADIAVIGLVKNGGGSTDITMAIVAPGTGGQAPADITNATIYLQYTFVKAAATNTIYAYTADAIPTGTTLKVVAGTPAGTGSVGSASGQITLSSTHQAVVGSIGSCYTGTATNGTEGAQLTYTFGIYSWTGGTQVVPAGSAAKTVVYTVTP